MRLRIVMALLDPKGLATRSKFMVINRFRECFSDFGEVDGLINLKSGLSFR
jgi:hypothetical protein